jgi:hypothetical protein
MVEAHRAVAGTKKTEGSGIAIHVGRLAYLEGA